MRNLQNLVPFVQAVRCGSFVAAASRLQVTPPAVSKSIARLEGELGVRLFNRSARRLDLTPEGSQFFDEVSKLLQGVDQAVEVLAGASREPQGVVRISVTATFGRHCLVPLLTGFTARHPRVELELSFDEAPPSLAGGPFDVRIQHGRSRETSHVSRTLCDYPIVLVASPGYLARRGVPRAPEDLASHDCINIRLPFGRAAWHLTRERTRPGRITPRRQDAFVHHPRGPLTIANQLDASLTASLSGAGIVPSSVPVILPHLTAGRLKVVLPAYRLQGEGRTPPQVYIQFPQRRQLSAKVRVFVDFLIEHFRRIDYTSMDLQPFAA